jgi:AGCS family alanine or glycine:cation symporter
METIDQFIAKFASVVWGLPLIILLIGGGLYLLIRSRFIAFRYLKHAIYITAGKYDNENDPGDISHFQALSTALASTIGMGNVAGVAVAISIGGPGAIFWMWVSGVVGMSTKFFTSTLAIMYRGKDSAGEIQGGPMYFITEGLGQNWKPLAVFFSVAGLVGALPIFNVNQLTQAIREIILSPHGWDYGFTTNLIIGLVLAGITSVVILGELERISKTASRLVPSMVILYFISVVSILIMYSNQVPRYFMMIFTEAFALKGESLFGGVLGALILLGIRRGAFSNEAGIGTAPLAHGAAKTSEPVREGLVAMLGPLIDTLIVCTLTALTILVTGVWQSGESNGVSLTAAAFESAFPVYGKYLLMLTVAAFSISSLFSYSYYGSKCLSYLIGADKKHYYNYFYIASILIGSTTSLSMMLNLIDGFFALMAIPTMTATLIMAPRVLAAAKDYFERMNSNSLPTENIKSEDKNPK